MKKSIYDQGEPKDNMMLAALKQAVANLKATNDSSVRDNNATAKPAEQAPVNPLQLAQVERKLDAADRNIPMNKNQSESGGKIYEKTPKSRDFQQHDYYNHQERERIQALENAKTQKAFERKIRNILYGEPLVDKPVPRDNGVYDAGDAWRNPTYAGGALAKNGVNTRGYTDTASDVGAPIRFTGGTMEDKRRKWDDAMARQAKTINDFNEYMGENYIDLSNLTAEQEDILDLVKKELTKKSILGTLTEEEKNRVFNNTLRFLFSHTKSANGDPYPVYIDIISNDYTKQMMPEPGSVKTEGLSDDDAKAIFDYGKHYSADEDQNEIYAKQREYKNEVYLEEVEKYNEDLRHGKAEIGDFQEYYDRAMMKIYENCTKPIPVKNTRGKVIGSIAIGDLVGPYDDSFGAKIAMNALEKLGTLYEDMDCEQLIKWAVAQENPDWGKYGIGSNAYYQSTRTEIDWRAKDKYDTISASDLHTGDILYWKNQEGDIVHTAIYLGNGYMIESAGTVKVTQLREKTDYGNGEFSYLAQVNNLDEGTLQENVEKYKKYH